MRLDNRTRSLPNDTQMTDDGYLTDAKTLFFNHAPTPTFPVEFGWRSR